MHAQPNTRWRKSSRSGGGENCVEIALGYPYSAVRDSKNATGPALRVEVAGLVTAVKCNQFDLD